MEWWERVMFPVKRVWLGVTTSLGFRKTGLGKLRQEVRTCEYEDVHVMWEMLRQTDAEFGRYRPVSAKRRRRRGRHVWAMFGWVSRGAPCNLCRGFRWSMDRCTPGADGERPAAARVPDAYSRSASHFNTSS